MVTTLNIPNSDVAVTARIVRPERGELSLAAARAILKFAFDPSDQDRTHILIQKAQAGTGIATSTLSALANGKRRLNVKHIRHLSAYFGLGAGVFLE